jgi:type I restriction enzyme, S subunit
MKKVALNDLLIKLESGSRPRGGVVEKGIPSLGGQHISSDGTYALEDLKFIPEEYFYSIKKGIIEKDDILIVKDGATTGKIAFIDENYPFKKSAINEHLFKLRVDSNKVIPKYVYYYLLSKKGNHELMKDFRGATVGGITRNFVRFVNVPLPENKETQLKIVYILDISKNLIEKRKAQIEALDQLMQSVFLEMFGDWNQENSGEKFVTLEEVTNLITDGVHSKPDYTESGIPFISVKDINKGKLSFEDCKYISEEAHKNYIKRCNPELGDILYTKVGATYGIPAIVDVDKEFSLYVSVALIKPKKEVINSIYLREALKSIWIKRQADRSIKGIGVPDLHLVEIKKFKLLLPSKEEQVKFEKIIKKIEFQRNLYEKSLKELESVFNSLLQRSFKSEFFTEEIVSNL